MCNRSPVLQISDLHVAYRRKEILRGASLEVHTGEIVALFGLNGTGKSTLLRAVAGVLKPSSGSVAYWTDGGKVELAGKLPYQINRLGVGYMLQGGQVFPGLSIDENIAIACQWHQSSNAYDPMKKANEWFPELSINKFTRAGLLSGGQRQMLALLMVLIQKPKLLLLDEPSAGLSPAVVPIVLGRIKKICCDEGCSALLVEQNIRQAAAIANHAFVLRDGLVYATSRDPLNILKPDLQGTQ